MSSPSRLARYLVAPALTGVLIVTGCSGSSSSGKGSTGGDTKDTQPGVAATGPLDFKPEVDGFSFENYGNEGGRTNLTAVEMRRYFGDAVCADMAGGTCTLTPPAKQWMDSINDGMNGGHCEGMATLALLIKKGQEKAADFGGATTNALKIDGNDKLSEEIAYWFATQAIDPSASAEIRTLKPSEVVDKLRTSFKGEGDSYTMGIYKTVDGKKKDGHAITPYAINDLGDGKVQIVLYDNNYPNQQRALDVDTKAETWRYNTSTNPSEPSGLYEGDATTGSLTLTPTSSRLQPKVCPFCGNDDGSGGTKGSTKGAAASEHVGYLFLDQDSGEAGIHLKVTAEDGSPLPGLKEIDQRNADSDKEIPPVLQVPIDKPFKVVIDGSAESANVTTNVTFVGEGDDLYIDNIHMEKGQVDTAIFDPVNNALTYETSSGESPDLGAGFTSSGADYDFSVGGVDLPSGGKVKIQVDHTNGTFVVVNQANATGTYALSLDRYDDNGTLSFTHDGVDLGAGDTLSVKYSDWDKKGEKLSGQITGPTGKGAVEFDSDK